MKTGTNNRWNDDTPVYPDGVTVTGIVLFILGMGIISWMIAGVL